MQQNDFKKRLAEKKKKYHFSISDNDVNNDVGKVFKKIGINSINISDNNESLDFISEKDFKFSEKDFSSINSLTNNTNTDKNSNNDNSSNSIKIIINNNNILVPLKNEDLKSVEGNNIGEEKNINNILTDISFENKVDNNSEKSNKSSKIDKSIKFTNKTLFLEKMKFNFYIYSNDYYDYFFKKVCDQIIKDYNNNFNELAITLTDIIVNYINQKKELKYLITLDSDDTYKNEINTIIQQLKEEEKKTQNNLILENGVKIGKINDKYLGPLNTFQSAHDLQILKERLKLYTIKSLNNCVFK